MSINNNSDGLDDHILAISAQMSEIQTGRNLSQHLRNLNYITLFAYFLQEYKTTPNANAEGLVLHYHEKRTFKEGESPSLFRFISPPENPAERTGPVRLIRDARAIYNVTKEDDYISIYKGEDIAFTLAHGRAIWFKAPNITEEQLAVATAEAIKQIAAEKTAAKTAVKP